MGYIDVTVKCLSTLPFLMAMAASAQPVPVPRGEPFSCIGTITGIEMFGTGTDSSRMFTMNLDVGPTGIMFQLNGPIDSTVTILRSMAIAGYLSKQPVAVKYQTDQANRPNVVGIAMGAIYLGSPNCPLATRPRARP